MLSLAFGDQARRSTPVLAMPDIEALPINVRFQRQKAAAAANGPTRRVVLKGVSFAFGEQRTWPEPATSTAQSGMTQTATSAAQVWCRAAEATAPPGKSYSNAMPFSVSSFFAFSFFAKCVSPMPRSTLGALVN
jgi:hypothetical protein